MYFIFIDSKISEIPKLNVKNYLFEKFFIILAIQANNIKIKNQIIKSGQLTLMVQPMRLELTRFSPHAPQACASAIPPRLRKCLYIITNWAHISNNNFSSSIFDLLSSSYLSFTLLMLLLWFSLWFFIFYF